MIWVANWIEKNAHDGPLILAGDFKMFAQRFNPLKWKNQDTKTAWLSDHLHYMAWLSLPK